MRSRADLDRRTTRSAAASDSAAAVDLAPYLEAKFALDERSLNREVLHACTDRLTAKDGMIRWLDVGTGTGAMIRRLLAQPWAASVTVTALDQAANLLGSASAALAAQLQSEGYRVLVHSRGFEAQQAGRHVFVDFQCCSLFDFEPKRLPAYDLITAHGVMDIVPVKPAIGHFAAWLAHGGMLYASLNYDGDTALFPLYRDEAFEAAVLAEYDASMERRRVSGKATGGSRSGRRVHAALCEANFNVLVYGTSDWNVTPVAGRYRARDAEVLRTLLAWIRRESELRPAVDRRELERWYATRQEQLEHGELGMIVHQLDLLATIERNGSRVYVESTC